MSKKEYRISINSSDIVGFQFLQDVITVAKTGAELDIEQVRMQFPHNAVFFLKTDKDFENTPTISYVVLKQEFNSEEDLDALSIDQWRSEMKKVGIKARDRAAGTAEYLSKFVPLETVKEEKPTSKTRQNKLQTVVPTDSKVLVEEVKE